MKLKDLDYKNKTVKRTVYSDDGTIKFVSYFCPIEHKIDENHYEKILTKRRISIHYFTIKVPQRVMHNSHMYFDDKDTEVLEQEGWEYYEPKTNQNEDI